MQPIHLPPMPASLGAGRAEFDDLLNLRTRLLHNVDQREQVNVLFAVARSFADAVDRGNDARQYLRQPPLDYVDAVVLTGTGGELLVDGVEYDEAPVYWHSRAGDVDSVIRGRDLDGYLRTGDPKYRGPLGLPT